VQIHQSDKSGETYNLAFVSVAFCIFSSTTIAAGTEAWGKHISGLLSSLINGIERKVEALKMWVWQCVQGAKETSLKWNIIEETPTATTATTHVLTDKAQVILFLLSALDSIEPLFTDSYER
jgi:hypothetical protein